MYSRNEDGSESFGFPAFLKVVYWLGAILFAPATIVVAMRPLIDWEEPGPLGAFHWVVDLVLVAFCALITACFIRVARRMNDRVHVDGRSIRYEGRDGWLVTLPWDRVAKVIDRTTLYRLELHGADESPVLKLDYQLAGFRRLFSIVLERTAPEALGEAPSLPATFRLPTLSLAAIAGGSFFAVAMAVACIVSRGWLGGLFLPLGLVWLFAWYVVRVDRDAVTFRYPLWRRTVRMEEIDEVWIAVDDAENASVSLTVCLRLRGGKVRKVQGIHPGSLAFFRAVIAAREACVS
jgi:hypothetical protein